MLTSSISLSLRTLNLQQATPIGLKPMRANSWAAAASGWPTIMGVPFGKERERERKIKTKTEAASEQMRPQPI